MRFQGFLGTGAAILSAVVVLVSGCERHLPGEFRTESDFTATATDLRACTLLSSDTVRTEIMVIGTDTVRTEQKTFVPVVGAVLERPAIAAWMSADDAFIRDRLDTLVQDTTLLVENPAGEDTVYAFFRHAAGAPAGAVFAVGWSLTRDNIDAFVEIDLFRKNGERVPVRSSAIAPEAVAACTQTVNLGDQVQTLPTVRGRFSYEWESGPLLVRFVLSEPATVGTFRVAVLPEG